MSVALRPQPLPEDRDERVFLHGTWKDYELVLLARGERSVPRVAYLEGCIEIMSPGRSHEYVKKNLARMIEAWALREDLDVQGFGSWTLKDPLLERGVEPDECYVLGSGEGRERPDLAIEVVWSHGGLDKLEIYRKLGVAEVWFWDAGRITVHVLDGERYREAERSAVLPDLDLRVLERFCDLSNQTAAVKGFLAAL